MGVRPSTTSALLLAALVLAPALAPLAVLGAPAPPPDPPTPVPPVPARLHAFRDLAALRSFLVATVPAPLGALERALDAAPVPFGPSPGERALAALDARPALGRAGADAPAVQVSGIVELTADWNIPGSLDLANAEVRFLAPGLAVRVGGGLTITDSTLRTVGLAPTARGTIEANAALDVLRGTFQGVTLVARNSTALPSRVADSVFQHTPGSGVVADRPGIEVRGSTFLNLSTGVEVRDAHGFPERGPSVHNNTFEMASYGISVSGDAAGQYRHNVFRANFQGVSCTSPGATDQQGNAHRAAFFENNLFTNYGEAISGLRGISVPTPIGTIEVASSACDHDRPYLGPAGAARDSVFLSSSDTLTNVRTSPNPTSAPPLPVPVTEVTTTATWNGPRALTGPVVVNSPGFLTIEDAQLQGPYPVGAKANGRLTLRDSTADPLTAVILRNADDLVDGATLGGRYAANPAVMYRCNCTVRDSDLQAGAGMALTALAGLLTDDTQWRPTIEGNVIHDSAVGGTFAVMRPQVTGNTFRDLDLALLELLGSTNFQDNVVQRATLGVTAILDTFTSGGNRYESGLIGFVLALSTTTFSEDIVAAFQIGMVPAIPTTFSMTLGNLTFNGLGVVPILGVASLTTTNLVDNYFWGLVTLPIDTGDIDIPTGITCTTCWGPADEGRFGNVSYVAGLGPNAAPAPPWAGQVRRALDGQTVDLGGTLTAPAVARSGGTLRVRDTAVDLAATWPIGAKGGGQSGGATGALAISNATVRNGGFIALNSTASSITHSVFEAFPDAAITALWNGGTYACNAARDVGAAFRYNLQKNGPMVLRQWLVEGGAGLSLGLLDGILMTQDGRVEDSGITRPAGGGLFYRAAAGGADLHGSNLLGPPGAVGARDDASEVEGLTLTPFDATGNWWGTPLGAGQGGTRFAANGDLAPLLGDPAGAAFAPALCQAWDVTSAQPREDAPVAFLDRTIDPSALGLADRAWDFGDGQTAGHAPGAATTHAFPDGGTYTVALTATSHSGAAASLARSVAVQHTPPRPAFDALAADELTAVQFTDRSAHGNPNDAAPDGWTYAWSFGDGATSTARDPQRRYADGGTYLVRLNTTDNDGLKAETTRSVAVAHVPPVASFSVTGAVESDTFQLQDTSTHPNAPTDGIAARSWSCTDGFASTAANPSHRFADGGTYACTLTVTDNDGQSGTATRAITVGHVAPAAGFGVAGSLETAALAFTDQSTHPNAPVDAPPAGWGYAWVFGDGATSAERSPSHRFADGGAYDVTLAVTDNDGQAHSVHRTVQVAHVPPVAAFAFSPGAPEPGAEVVFTDLSTHPNAPADGLAAWAWDFGDGATSTARHPAHVFAAQGNYDVQLTVTDDDGLTASVTRRVSVGNLPPLPLFTSHPEEPTDLDTVQFTDQSTDPDGSIVAWHWAFGDGATSTAQHPAHRFADDGLYTVVLTVTDDRGASASLAQVLEVRNVAPAASFAFGPDDPVAGETVTFADSSTDPDGAVVAWAWDFGDGTTSAAQHPTHAWAQGGDYLVTLVVTDDDGATHAAQVEVHVCETQVNLDGSGPLLEVCLRMPL